MITVEEALRLVNSNSPLLVSNRISLTKALDHVLFEDIISPINMPPFRQSAMDGYALNWVPDSKSFNIIGEVPAGSSNTYNLNIGEGVRIFTGAKVPVDANIVVPQELIDKDGGQIKIKSIPKVNQHIRPLGEQIMEGHIALKKGELINVPAIAYLASLGIDQVEVYRKPKICVIVTGNELVKTGQPLDDGKIYESNSIMLNSALQKFGFFDSKIISIKDDYQETKNQIKKAFTEYDTLIVSGGISVGDYDFVGKALTEIGCDTIFYKVKQKPGKPLFFGRYKNKSVFALPGNPAAALTSFYIYVLPHLNQSIGKKNEGLKTSKAKLNRDYVKKGDRGQFLKGIVKDEIVTILEGQASSMLHTFSQANAIIYLPLEKSDFSKGDQVKIYHLDS